MIDPRSFHTFEWSGDKLLFDRASGSLLEVDDVTYGFFHSLETHSPHLLSQEEHELVESTVLALQESGMFKYVPVDHDEQAALIESLLDHHPMRVQMLMAQGCNLGCRYCYAWRNGSNQKKTLMPFEVAKASVDHLVRNSSTRTDLQVTFFGGEPLLNLEVIRQVVSYCRDIEKATDKKFLFELITNGTLLNKEIIDWLVAEKFLLFISMDGWREMHNHNRPSMDGTDQYDIILANALYANEQFNAHNLFPIKVRANLTNKFHDAKEVGDYLYGLGFKVVGVGAIEPLPHGDASPSAMTEDQMDSMAANSRGMMLAALEKLEQRLPVTGYEKKMLTGYAALPTPLKLKGITCGVARNTQVVDNRGNIYPCHRYEGMENYIVGHVSHGLDRDKTRAYYRKLNGNATNRCHSCWIRDYCGGGCAWLLSKKDGHLVDPTERECERRRKSMETGLVARRYLRATRPQNFAGDDISMDSWSWGTAADLNEADDMEMAGLTEQGDEQSCGSGCETCGPTGCGN